MTEKRHVDKDNIDDLVESWHEGDSDCALHEYLGFTLEEYSRWVETGILPQAKEKGRD